MSARTVAWKQEEPAVVTSDDRPAVFDMNAIKAENNNAPHRYHSLAHGKPDRKMEPFFVEVMPVREDEVTLSSHQGEELIIVKTGRLRVVHGNEKSVLEPGDSVYFNSIVPHYISACGDEPCAVYATFYYPA
jgi:mannose-6-phosphate isomerase-like protein (cupin superfamily)